MIHDLAHNLKVVLCVTGDPDYKGYAGDFMTQLCNLGLKCDEVNLERLAQGFPVMAHAIRIWRYTPYMAKEFVVASTVKGKYREGDSDVYTQG